nr:MAG TPA_asm: hypothetical protein [Caudoviricetes sp.]
MKPIGKILNRREQIAKVCRPKQSAQRIKYRINYICSIITNLFG